MSDKKVIIPYAKLSSEALSGVIEEFILREGTDYGAHEVTYGQKVKNIVEQLKNGDVIVVYDEASESCTLIKD